ncbi:uncharacterized protein KD926_001477 [Aspergillus affinis]|uniref:uncharacterized protein n=1 Tax=Aspergillus affinis TaxID=1070780 RepID=UPI0022FF431F|nr:uncharacterized protein KD926_001477 [Aspergillus affinis]KAI9044247.1 hypothetical protein KD926_001477 [Aspergillus affinis]
MDPEPKSPSRRSPLIGKSPDVTASLQKSVPIDIEVQGLKAKVLLNRPQEDIVPEKYLQKADRSSVVQRTPWAFRGVEDARQVNLGKWSKVDVRFRGVFRMLNKVPQFKKGLYQNEDRNIEGCSRKYIFEDAARAQGQVVYALLEEILNLLDIRREMDSHLSYFFLRARLLNCHMEYWTGYRQKHQDAPLTAGWVCVDTHPAGVSNKSILPISTTTKAKQSLESALEGKFKLILTNLLLHIHKLHPPGDKFPDQEVFLIGLHGSRLHILRAIFPGYKTSKIWSGRYNPSPSNTDSTELFTMNPSERFYSKQNVERFVERVEWHKLSNADGERDSRVFRILGSHEYDLWIKSEFRAAVRLVIGLIMYLMSGQARCGILQHAFQRFPYDEDDEPNSEDERGDIQAAKEEKDVAEKEKELDELEKQSVQKDQERARTRDTMRSSSNDRIRGFEDSRQPWWEWVWEDKVDEERAKNDDVICNGPQ